MHDIFKGNLSPELKADILDVLRMMLESGDAEKQKYAITTMLTYKRDLSVWPANGQED